MRSAPTRRAPAAAGRSGAGRPPGAARGAGARAGARGARRRSSRRRAADRERGQRGQRGLRRVGHDLHEPSGGSEHPERDVLFLGLLAASALRRRPRCRRRWTGPRREHRQRDRRPKSDRMCRPRSRRCRRRARRRRLRRSRRSRRVAGAAGTCANSSVPANPLPGPGSSMTPSPVPIVAGRIAADRRPCRRRFRARRPLASPGDGRSERARPADLSRAPRWLGPRPWCRRSASAVPLPPSDRAHVSGSCPGASAGLSSGSGASPPSGSSVPGSAGSGSVGGSSVGGSSVGGSPAGGLQSVALRRPAAAPIDRRLLSRRRLGRRRLFAPRLGRVNGIWNVDRRRSFALACVRHYNLGQRRGPPFVASALPSGPSDPPARRRAAITTKTVKAAPAWAMNARALCRRGWKGATVVISADQTSRIRAIFERVVRSSMLGTGPLRRAGSTSPFNSDSTSALCARHSLPE